MANEKTQPILIKYSNKDRDEVDLFREKIHYDFSNNKINKQVIFFGSFYFYFWYQNIILNTSHVEKKVSGEQSLRESFLPSDHDSTRNPRPAFNSPAMTWDNWIVHRQQIWLPDVFRIPTWKTPVLNDGWHWVFLADFAPKELQTLKKQSVRERYNDKRPYYFGSIVLPFGILLIDDRVVMVNPVVRNYPYLPIDATKATLNSINFQRILQGVQLLAPLELAFLNIQ